jgi:hypothetical protein
MRVHLMLGCVVVAAAAVLGCGKSEEEKRAEEIEAGAESMAKSAEGMAKGMEEMAKGLGALTGGDPNQNTVEPVSFRELQATFGDIAGWEKGKPTGERMSLPVNFSRAEVRYTKGDSNIEVEISDSAFNQMLLVPYSMFLTSGYEKETSEGYEKSTKVGQYPGWEKWNTEDKDGELNAIVNKRFIVQVRGNQLEDAQVLQTAMASVDLKKLESLK